MNYQDEQCVLLKKIEHQLARIAKALEEKNNA